MTKKNLKFEAADAIESIANVYYNLRKDAKITHWKNPSKQYGVHVSIDSFVDDIDDAIDSYIETTMGANGIYDVEVSGETKLVDVAYLSDVYSTVEQIRELIEDKPTQSLIDNLQNITKQLIYRLTYTI